MGKTEKKNTEKKQKKLQQQYDDQSLLNIWRGNGFVMCGLGKKSKLLAKIKHFLRCIKWSRQRVHRGFADCDVWNLYSYIQELMPAMLQYLKDNRMGSPGFLGENVTDEHGVLQISTCHEEWDKILDRMIFLWKESSEDTCSKKNQYEEAYTAALDEFTEKYGILGQKLETEEEKEHFKKSGGGHYIHTMRELPEYEEIDRLYTEESKKLDKYREACKDEAFDLMKQYFFSLWD